VTRYGDFPDDLQHLIDDLDEEGFSIIYGEVKGLGGGPGFTAERGATVIHVEDWTQTWAFSCRDPERPDYNDTWAYPSRVRDEVWKWLDESTD